MITTLRPSGAGDSTQLKPVNSSLNWQNVDEASPDNTYNYNQESESWKLDLYALPDPGLSGVINKVTFYYRGAAPGGSLWKGALKTGGTVYYSGDKTNDAEVTYYTEYANNPKTGSPWTWDEINALQIGGSCKSRAEEQWRESILDQVYVVVDYTPITETAYNTRVGNPTSWVWEKCDYGAAEQCPVGSEPSWIWKAPTSGGGEKTMQGLPTSFSWGSE